jgi:hypothetical protein
VYNNKLLVVYIYIYIYTYIYKYKYINLYIYIYIHNRQPLKGTESAYYGAMIPWHPSPSPREVLNPSRKLSRKDMSSIATLHADPAHPSAVGLQAIPAILHRLCIVMDQHTWGNILREHLSRRLVQQQQQQQPELPALPPAELAVHAPIVPQGHPVESELHRENVLLRREIVSKNIIIRTLRRRLAASQKRQKHTSDKHLARIALLSAEASRLVQKRGPAKRYFTIGGGYSLALRRAVSNTASFTLGLTLGVDLSGQSVRNWEVRGVMI